MPSRCRRWPMPMPGLVPTRPDPMSTWCRVGVDAGRCRPVSVRVPGPGPGPAGRGQALKGSNGNPVSPADRDRPSCCVLGVAPVDTRRSCGAGNDGVLLTSMATSHPQCEPMRRECRRTSSSLPCRCGSRRLRRTLLPTRPAPSRVYWHRAGRCVFAPLSLGSGCERHLRGWCVFSPGTKDSLGHSNSTPSTAVNVN
jgi:hypothetical protein